MASTVKRCRVYSAKGSTHNRISIWNNRREMQGAFSCSCPRQNLHLCSAAGPAEGGGSRVPQGAGNGGAEVENAMYSKEMQGGFSPG